MTVRVLVADDQALIRAGLTAVVLAFPSEEAFYYRISFFREQFAEMALSLMRAVAKTAAPQYRSAVRDVGRHRPP